MAEPSVQPPTREQIASEVKRVTHVWGGPAMDEFKNDPPIRKHYAIADAVLALFQQSTPSAETYGPDDGPAPWGHLPTDRIADMAPGTTFTAEGRDGTERLCAAANIDHTVADLDDCVFRSDDWFDPSTIRDVTPPKVTS